MMLTRFKLDAIERFLTTVVVVGLPLSTIETFHLPPVLVAPGALLLQILKLVIAKNVGNPNSASLVKSN